MANVKQGPQGSSIFVFVMAVVFLPTLLFYNINIYERKAEARNYSVIEGRVLDLQWQTLTKPCNGLMPNCRVPNQMVTYQTPVITYEYDVGGRVFTSSRYSFEHETALKFFDQPVPGSFQLEDIEAFSKLFAKGRNIKVFYDPQNPKLSVLNNANYNPDFKVYRHLLILFVLFLLVSAAAIAFNNLYITMSIFAVYYAAAWWIEQNADSFF